ncbi:xylulose kinase [Clostridium sulfidigenes]|uniref:Xylulose kinase n=1 Tax=Clostridium sulfidigenes TaxID=318464 RepID=A0A084JFJ7_9CLOT|nr:xylulokinase [Clostridium sulfidigenes]KEZ87731.1 xylulose kinase [Clostridium sulfidigenes]
MKYLLGIDIGTSGTKTVLFDRGGNPISSSTAEYPLYQPEIGWAEQDPQDWWNAVCITINQVIKDSNINPESISGIGLSGQMHGLVMLDGNGNVLRKSIIWCDQRTAKECVEITEKVGEKRLIDITANPALTGFTASKILWVRNNEPEIYEKCRKILLPKDYIRYMLTGEFATEVSDASGMQLLDIKNRCWSKEVLNALDIPIEYLGDVHESIVVSGKVHKKAAEVTGLKENTPVVGGAGDQAAGAIGNGIIKSGQISSTIGTSGVVFAHLDEPIIDEKGRVHTFCHAVPGAWHMMGVTQGAGLSLKWFRDNFCTNEIEVAKGMGIDPYVLMTKEAEKVPAGSRGVIYLPYLMGERTPHLNPKAKGVFFGLSAAHTKNEMLRAVIEGVSYSLLDCMEIIKDTGMNPTNVMVSGGGGKSELWRQILADMFNCKVSTNKSSEGPALGVALLAGVGTGVYKDIDEACSIAISENSVQFPKEENSLVYKRYYEIYKKIYDDLKGTFELL